MPAYHVTPAIHLGRKQLRQHLIACREALPADERRDLSERICAHLLDLLARLQPATLGFCWPYRAEPDIVAAIVVWLAEDERRQAALPVVPDLPGPLEYCRWRPDAAMQRDRFGIPQPIERITLKPELILVPVNGFDAQGYRIGYGGGFFDRTLAGLVPRPLTVGIGFELARLDSIVPEVHDLPLDWIITEAGSQQTQS